MRNSPFFKLNFWLILLIAAQVVAIIFLCVYIPSFMHIAAVFALVWILAAISALVLFSRKGDTQIKCVWLVFIASVPVVGALVYLIAAIPAKPCGILQVKGANRQGPASAASAMCGAGGAGYVTCEYFATGSDFWKSAETAIKTAKKSVYIEFFIVAKGHLFNVVCEALECARKQGAEIKIILDGVGSALRLSATDMRRLKKIGEVKVFHKLIPFPHPRINVRDHRKIISVDGRVAFTGGVNLADEYVNITHPHGHWKDTGIAVYGSVAKIFDGMFLAMWNGKHTMDAPAPLSGENECTVYCDSPASKKFCEDLYVNAISRAQKRVHILTPYFCASEKLSSALSFAARRGVDVKIIIPHIPDKKYAFAVSKAFAAMLAPSGIKFYEYTPGFMHAKCVICDGETFMGSYNFDYRSFNFNYECGIALGGDVTEIIERDFEECLALSDEKSYAKRGGLSGFILRFFAPLI